MALFQFGSSSFSFGQKNNKRPAITPRKEMGVSGCSIVGGYINDREKNPKLSFLQRSTRYEEIMSNIAIVGAGIRYFTSLGISAAWSVKAAEADTSEEYVEYVNQMMVNMEQSWSTVIKHALMYRYLGFSVQEWTAYRDEANGLIYYKSIENRPQRTIRQFDVEESGKVLGFGQESVDSGRTFYIPRSKTLYMVDDLIDDSPAGMGILRHVFESCERLKNYINLETQGFEKDLRGIPIGRIPYAELQRAVANGEIKKEEAIAAKEAMENLVKLARKLPETGITLDSKTYESRSETGITATGNPQWDLQLLQGVSPGLPDINVAIERIQREIARVLSAESMLLDGGGSNALSKDKSSNAYLAINSALHEVKEQINKDLLPPLWRLNGFPEEMMPCLEVEDVSAKDAASVAAVLRDMATAGAPLAPDDEAINDVRSLLGVSKADLDKAILSMVE